jgi:hypothetical protein
VLLSICCAHRQHPLSRFERFFLLVTVLVFQFAASLATKTVPQDPSTSTEDASSAVFPLSLLVAVLITILTTVLTFAATADDRCCGDRKGGLLRLYLKCAGSAFIAWQFIIAAMVLVILWTSFPHVELIPAAQVFGSSLAQSWTFVFLLSSALSFFFAWRKQKKEAMEMDRAHAVSKAQWEKEEAELKARAEEEPSLPVSPSDSVPPVASRTPLDYQQRALDAIDSLINPNSRPVSLPPKRECKKRTVVTPRFTFSFTELRQWDAGADIDARWEASHTSATAGSSPPEPAV